jgi:hypothetical protein
VADPKIPPYVYGVGTGGGPGGTHIYADLAEIMRIDSPQAKQFVLLATLAELASYASSIRDAQPAAYKLASQALDAGTRNLAAGFGVHGVT